MQSPRIGSSVQAFASSVGRTYEWHARHGGNADRGDGLVGAHIGEREIKLALKA
jgi:hypothetical protein